jgi:hypothetical protein
MAPETRQGPYRDTPCGFGDSRKHPATTVDKPVTGHFGQRSQESDPRTGRHRATIPSIPAHRHVPTTAGWLRPNQCPTWAEKAENGVTPHPLATGNDRPPRDPLYQAPCIAITGTASTRDKYIDVLAVLEGPPAHAPFPTEPQAFEGLLLTDVAPVGEGFDPVRSRAIQQVVHKQLLSCRSHPLPTMLGYHPHTDLVSDPRRETAGLPGSDADNRAVGAHDRNRRGLGGDVPVGRLSLAACPRITESGPLELSESIRIRTKAIEEGK